jgi:hypothetical protein
MLKFLCILIIISAIVGQDVPLSSSPLVRHYTEGQKLTYHMQGINENWHYEIQADGIVKKDSQGTYFEEYGWSHFISDGQTVALSPTSLDFRQQLTLDPNHKPGLTARWGTDLGHPDGAGSPDSTGAASTMFSCRE